MTTHSNNFFGKVEAARNNAARDATARTNTDGHQLTDSQHQEDREGVERPEVASLHRGETRTSDYMRTKTREKKNTTRVTGGEAARGEYRR